MRPLITIITVCKNAENFVESTIQSVLSQTYQNKEYIIIDGNSNDSTVEIISKYTNEIDCLISEPDNGISDAFNKGIERAHGDLIGVVNAGDIFYDENVLEDVAEAYSSGNEIIQGLLMLRNFDSWFEYVLKPSNNYGHLYSLVRFYPNHMATFIPKQIYEDYGKYRSDYKTCMDIELLYRYHRNNVKIRQIDRIIGIYRLGGISDKRDWNQVTEKLHILLEDNGNIIEMLLCFIILLLKVVVRKAASFSCGIDAIRTKGCKNIVNTLEKSNR